MQAYDKHYCLAVKQAGNRKRTKQQTNSDAQPITPKKLNALRNAQIPPTLRFFREFELTYPS